MRVLLWSCYSAIGQLATRLGVKRVETAGWIDAMDGGRREKGVGLEKCEKLPVASASVLFSFL